LTNPRHLPAAPLGPDGPYLAAVLGVLDDIRDMLDARLPTPTGGEPAPEPDDRDTATEVTEPAPAPAPPADEAIPIHEPAPRRAPRKATNKKTGRAG
jgi:hypothetical protein